CRHMDRQDQMRRTTDENHQLAEFAVGHLFCRLFAFFGLMRPPDEIATGMMRLKPGGVGSGMFDRAFFLRECKRLAKQLMHLLRLEQSDAGFLKRGVMGDLLEADGLAKPRVILQERNDAAIVLLLMDLEHQACKELGLGILPGCK